ncbi:WG repeat protein [Winogradskyella wandonensis]|uniref:WG repeat protein n=1 Tax=Winogradskyella wandonensis TaxID=1442586 RepID=A0A4R1KJ89_9FLAO|nr:WG repeat-containing protein [Winogradskyella wandonensis]TCK64824.1 WG repeat protein [Winogradskyella wandonensis]
MKRLVLLLATLLLSSTKINAQKLNDISFISPYNDGVAAIQKNNQWAFINVEGKIVVDYRDDLVLTTFEKNNYPVFNSGRCLIKEVKDGISYFGYIDKDGNTIVKPQYLNATNFENGLAIILELHKNNIGKNDVLDKKMIDYSYTESAINPNGKIVHFLSDKPTHITLSKDYIKIPPEIKSKFISETLVAQKNGDKTWSIKAL